MKSIEWIGWVSSFLLVLTMSIQLRKQIRENTSKGVSKWLYLGQLGAEVGFVLYAYLVRNWVFVVTNAALLIENVIGIMLVLRHRRLEGSGNTPVARVA
jgi:MtN3 and saliva related transmembrane protein